MSDELAQDDEGFEIADFGADDDDEDDPENAGAKKSARSQPGQEGARYDPTPSATATTTKPAAKAAPRESLDGETIFAVGEDNDRWSDEESEEERGGLVKKQSKD